MIFFWRHSKITPWDLWWKCLSIVQLCQYCSIGHLSWKLFLQNQIVFVILDLRVNYESKVLANTSALELTPCKDTFMVVFPVGQLVASANKQTMSTIGNSSLQQAGRAIISASIMGRAVSLCNFDCWSTRHSTKVMMNPMQLLAHAGSVWFSWPGHMDMHQFFKHCLRSS